jgi:hypothetical protein
MISKKNLPHLISHIERERARCEPARTALRKQILTWYKLFEMDNTELKRNIPFQGASHACQPLLWEETKLLYGKLWAMQFKHRPLLSAFPTAMAPSKEVVDITLEIQHSLDHILYNEIEVRRKTMPITLEGLLCGMGVAHVPYRVETKTIPVYVPGKDKPSLFPQVTYANPDIQHVPLAHCGWPPEASTLETARWFFRDVWLSPDELIEMTYDENVDRKAVFEILDQGSDNESEWDQMLGEMINFPSHNSPHVRLMDWWGWYRNPDVKTAMPMMYNVVLHPGTRKAILNQYNPYEDQNYPFAIWNFFPRPNKLLGIGVGRLLTDLNASLNEIWNQRVNAGRIANTKVFKIRKGSGLGPKDKIYPGKRLYLVNPATDVMEMAFGDVKQSAYADETNIWGVADRIVSVNEYQRGNQTISRPNASGQMALLNIAEENISIIGDNLRVFWSRIGRLLYSRSKQFAPPEKLLPSYPADQAAMFLEALGSKKITFDLAAADERINPEAERQKLATAYQMYTGYYQTLLQYGQLIASPEMPPLIKTIAVKASLAMTRFMKRIGRNLNLKGFEEFLVEDIYGADTESRIPATAGPTGPNPAGGEPRLPQGSAPGQLGAGGPYPRAVAGESRPA